MKAITILGFTLLSIVLAQDPTLVTLPYCARLFVPYCPSGCNFFEGTSVPCGSSEYPCVDLSFNISVSNSFSTEPCFTAEPQEVSKMNIYCRIDPTTNQLCLNTDDNNQRCFRQREIISYNFYTYANSAFAKPYFVLLGYNTCENQLVETEEERAQYVPLCQELNQPQDGDQEKIIIQKFGCTDSSCSTEPSNSYALNRSSTYHTEVMNSEGFGVRFNGATVCFSWKKRTTNYFYGAFDPETTSECLTQCVELSELPSFRAVYSKVINYSTNENSYQFRAVNQNGEYIDETTSGSSKIVALGSLASFIVLSLFV